MEKVKILFLFLTLFDRFFLFFSFIYSERILLLVFPVFFCFALFKVIYRYFNCFYFTMQLLPSLMKKNKIKALVVFLFCLTVLFILLNYLFDALFSFSHLQSSTKAFIFLNCLRRVNSFAFILHLHRQFLKIKKLNFGRKKKPFYMHSDYL